MPMLRLLFLALCLCLAPCTPRADGLFIVDDDLITGIRPGLPMRIVPTTDRNQPDPRVDAHAPLIYLDRDVQKAAALREKALNGDMEALLHLAVLSRVGEEEKQPPLTPPSLVENPWCTIPVSLSMGYSRKGVSFPASSKICSLFL